MFLVVDLVRSVNLCCDDKSSRVKIQTPLSTYMTIGDDDSNKLIYAAPVFMLDICICPKTYPQINICRELPSSCHFMTFYLWISSSSSLIFYSAIIRNVFDIRWWLLLDFNRNLLLSNSKIFIQYVHKGRQKSRPISDFVLPSDFLPFGPSTSGKSTVKNYKIIILMES